MILKCKKASSKLPNKTSVISSPIDIDEKFDFTSRLLRSTSKSKEPSVANICEIINNKLSSVDTGQNNELMEETSLPIEPEKLKFSSVDSSRVTNRNKTKHPERSNLKTFMVIMTH